MLVRAGPPPAARPQDAASGTAAADTATAERNLRLDGAAAIDPVFCLVMPFALNAISLGRWSGCRVGSRATERAGLAPEVDVQARDERVGGGHTPDYAAYFLLSQSE
ncbi:hypothetical protein GCM10009735_10520 [Actinomadura chokoriensis]